jgi:demethylmenaquinone methyltransferase/2-methoxy-6-polyprenyl-1,4-benzoquinol methylase
VAQLQGEEKSRYVQDMFGRIARRYNLMNRVMTMGQDQRWRRFVVQKAQVPVGGHVLDLATGTGDIAFEVVKAVPTAQVVGGDFAIPMMLVGQQQKMGDTIHWAAADALRLPFASARFDAVVSGYLVRNVPDIRRTLEEKHRVLKDGGRVVILDSSPPRRNLLRPFIMIYLKIGIPLLGRLISGKQGADAYTYLPESTQSFKTPEELAALMREAGFEQVAYKMFMFGTMAVHWGIKP